MKPIIADKGNVFREPVFLTHSYKPRHYSRCLACHRRKGVPIGLLDAFCSGCYAGIRKASLKYPDDWAKGVREFIIGEHKKRGNIDCIAVRVVILEEERKEVKWIQEQITQ